VQDFADITDTFYKGMTFVFVSSFFPLTIGRVQKFSKASRTETIKRTNDTLPKEVLLNYPDAFTNNKKLKVSGELFYPSGSKS